MKINKAGIDLIKQFEGCRLSAYTCPAGVLTIGYGHTGKDVKRGMVIDDETAAQLLLKDIAKFEKLVEKYAKTYDFNTNEFSALVSFAYNIGNIDTLTANGKRTREEIKNKMLEYNKANGRTLSGLVNRRRAELKLFNTPVYDKGVKTCRVIARSGLNLREKPSETCRVIKALPYGTELAIVSDDKTDWLNVKYNNINGYVARRWVE